MSLLTPAKTPRTKLTPTREADPVFFPRPDQRPSGAASDMVSFGLSEDEGLDDDVSLAASDAEGLSGLIYDPALSQSGEPNPDPDAKLLRILSRAMDEFGLEWSLPEEPTRSRLDKWFQPGCRQAPPPQRASQFFPVVHEELTRSWPAPYLAHLRNSCSSARTAADGAEEKGYGKLPPLDESVAAHRHRLDGKSCPHIQGL